MKQKSEFAGVVGLKWLIMNTYREIRCMEKINKAVIKIFFVINALLSVFALIIAFSQYMMMVTHFGSMSVYAKQQGLNIAVMLFLSVCIYLVKRIKKPWIAMILSMLLTVIIFIYFTIIVSVR